MIQQSGLPMQNELPPSIGVIELTNKLKDCVQHFFGQVCVKAEVGSFKAGRNGHYYLTLKEDKASIDAMIWASDARSMAYQPKIGDEVIVQGAISMRPGSGQSSLHIKYLIPTGEGLMQLEFDKTFADFKAQGLFDRARPLPLLPKGIGLITSVNSSAYHDFFKTVNERAPGVPVYVADASMQGADCLASVSNALRQMYQDPRVEVIALTRGGGSLESLWNFNHRDLCLFLARSPKPTVVGIGHEDNTLIAELVADVRGHTPTKVAEAILPKSSDLKQGLHSLVRQMEESLSRIGMSRFNRLAQLSQALEPLCKMDARRQRVDELNYNLQTTASIALRSKQQRLENLYVELNNRSPILRVERAKYALADLNEKLVRYDGLQDQQLNLEQLHTQLDQALDHLLSQQDLRLNRLIERLELLSPLKTLSRGYSLVTTEDKTVVQKASQTSVGDSLDIKLREGELKVTVMEASSG